MAASRHTSRREVVALLGATLLGYLAAAWFDLFEKWASWSRRHEELDIDELAVASAVLIVGLSVYAWRRYVESIREAQRLGEVERALAETNEEYRSLFEYHPDSVFSFDLEGRYVSANPASVQLAGYSADELQTMGFPEVLVPESLPRALAAFERVVGGQAEQLEVTVWHKDGHQVEVSLVAVPIVVGGEVIGVYGIGEDVTERNRMHRELAEARVAAEQASEAKSAFLANVSHEIRTPLTSVLGATEMVLETELQPDQDRLLRTVHRSGSRLLRLVNELLDFARIEAGESVLHFVDYDLRDVLGDVATLAESRTTAKGLRFETTVGADVPALLRGDPLRVAQILNNLVDNAVKFTEEGHVSVTVTGEQDADGRRVRLEVADTGIGMSEAERDRVFEAFSQADSSITRQYGGTGLGLTISRRLARRMGGGIEVESAPGRGSTFVVTLPVDCRAELVEADLE